MVEDPKVGDSNFEQNEHDDHNSIAYLMWTKDRFDAGGHDLRKVTWKGNPPEEEMVIPKREPGELGHTVAPFEYGTEPAYIDPICFTIEYEFVPGSPEPYNGWQHWLEHPRNPARFNWPSELLQRLHLPPHAWHGTYRVYEIIREDENCDQHTDLIVAPLLSSISEMGLHAAHRKDIDCEYGRGLIKFRGYAIGKNKYTTITIKHNVTSGEYDDPLPTQGYDGFLQRDKIFAANHPWRHEDAHDMFNYWTKN